MTAWLLTVSLGAVLTVEGFAGAQSIDDTRSARDANRSEQTRVAAELDILKAQRSEIVAALEGLDQAVAYQQGKVDSARADLVIARAAVVDRQRRLEQTAGQIAETQARVTASVVDAYVGGTGDDTGWLAAEDATEATQRNQLLGVVRGRFTDDLEQLRVLRQRGQKAKAEADDAVARAATLESTLAADLDELDAQRATQARLEAALQGRIGEVQSQADRLKASEDELTGKINGFLAEQAAAAARASGVSAASVARPKLTASSAGGFIVPVASGAVSSSFGYRRHPILGTVRLHAGTDFAADEGEPTWATKSGKVIFAGWNGGYGNCVIIGHAGGVSSLYGHLSEILVSEGGTVSQGETIGLVGTTGMSTGAHLHFEIRVGDEPTDPMNFL